MNFHEKPLICDPEAANRPINELGWIDRKIELVAVPMAQGREWEINRRRSESGVGGEGGSAAQADRIAKWISKSTLISGETIAVLRHMDATGQF